MKREIDLLIFDFDGTLVDSRKDIITAVNTTLRECGRPEKPAGEIESYIGTGVEDLLRQSLGESDENLFSQAMRLFEEYYRYHHADTTTPYAGVVETLAHFAGKKRAVITNRRRESAGRTLVSCGLHGYFDELVGGDDLACMKPAACPIERVLFHLKVARSRAVMIGDMAIDVTAGRGAGVLTCAVTYGIGKREDLIGAAPDYLIDRITALQEIFS